MQKTTRKIPFEDKKAEAIKRMVDMGFNKDIVQGYKKCPTDGYAIIDKYGGTNLFEYEETLREVIADIEYYHNALVYAVIRSRTESGIIDNLLVVSDDKRCWGVERMAGKEHTPISCVVNYNDPDCYEITKISIMFNERGIPIRIK